jgi:hypothetical protein
MKIYTKLLFVSCVLFLSTPLVQAQTMYKVTLLRAAPGKLLPLIENLKTRVTDYEKIGSDTPFIIRHSQGDQWDVMVYEYIGNYQSYYAKEGLNQIFTPSYGDDFYSLISFHETIFSQGPSYEVVSALFEKGNFFHVEMFVALPGKQKELLEQRKMENVYLKEINRNPNLIFTVEQGAHWDNFTLGGYRDIKHFAESADIPLEVEEKAAIKAGFKGVMDISPYLRSLISMHHDTLGKKVN